MPNELEQFYKSLTGKGALALEPGDSRYVPLLEENDPIEALCRRIKLAESESVHLLTGFRGNGKSTQLKRLKKMLEDKAQCTVFLVDMLDYVLMTKPIDIADFTLSLMAALSFAVSPAKEESARSGKPASFVEDYGKLAPWAKEFWEKFTNALPTGIEADKLTLKLPAADLALKLKTDQTFKKQIQEHFKGRPTRISDAARQLVVNMVGEIRRQKGSDRKVVLLVDSLEQLRGMGEEAQRLYDSVRELFFGQAHNLSFSMLHIVYTVPPYLPVLAPNIGLTLGGNPITGWPNIHVRDQQGEADKNGLEIMKDIVEKRFAAWTNFMSPELMHKFAGCSGGDIREFFRLLREAAISLMSAREKNKEAVLDEPMAERVIQLLKNELLPIAEKDAQWLVKIHESKKESLLDKQSLPDLARFFDSNLIMNYLNGKPWYDVHPLLVEEIETITKKTSDIKD